MDHPFHFGGARHQRSLLLRETVVALFTPRRDFAMAQLPDFTEGEWRRNLMWLDASGLALYLIHELDRSNRADLLPPFLVQRLRQNLADNRQRSASLFEDMMALNHAFQARKLQFANLKGMTLGPESVPDPALRNQLDLDFAIVASDAPQAAIVLAEHGYALQAIEKNAWEFKTSSSSIPTIGDLYKPRPQRCVELHLASFPTTLLQQQLGRAEHQMIRGACLPTLSPADIFINQCTHLFGHFRTEFTRSSWGLELARHIQARFNDSSFWLRIAELVDTATEGRIAIGASLLAIESLYGTAAPTAFRHWAVSALSPSLAAWVRRYAPSALLSDFPGNKFHHLLSDPLSPRNTSRKVLPRRLPRMIVQASPHESLVEKVLRYRTQFAFLRYRLRFHSVQTVRLLVERRRWRVSCGCKGMTFSQPTHDNPPSARS